MWVEGEVERRKEGGRRNVEQCVRTTPFREPLSRAAWPSTLSISLHKALRRRGQRLRRTNYSTTILRPSASSLTLLSLLFLSLSQSVPVPTYPPTIPHPILAILRTYNLHHHMQPIQQLTFSLYPLGPLTLPISLFSSLTLRLDSLFLAHPLLRYRLLPYVSLSFSLPLFSLSLSLLVSRFIARSLAGHPSSHPRAHRYCLPLSHPYTIVLFWPSSSNPRIDFTLPYPA